MVAVKVENIDPYLPDETLKESIEFDADIGTPVIIAW